MKFSDLTIISIGLNANDALRNTYNSIEPLLLKDVKWIVVLSNSPEDLSYLKTARLITGLDKSLYNALNIGIDNVSTDYFMFIHAGDTLINHIQFAKSFDLIRTKKLDLILGGAKIGKRIHLSQKWRPWMFKYNVQPPHLPIIYKTNFIGSTRFDEVIPVISDFFMLKKIFDLKPNYMHSGYVYISMELGGLTSSGIKSFFFVSKLFKQINNDNLFYSFMKLLSRFLIKIYLK